MLEAKEKGIIIYIIKHCNRIEEKIVNISKDEFDNNEDLKEIICFNIFQIGELAKKLSIDFQIKYNKVPWKDIKGMRDFIGHGYGTMDFDIVWKTATEEINILRDYCEHILKCE